MAGLTTKEQVHEIMRRKFTELVGKEKENLIKADPGAYKKLSSLGIHASETDKEASGGDNTGAE